MMRGLFLLGRGSMVEHAVRSMTYLRFLLFQKPSKRHPLLGVSLFVQQRPIVLDVEFNDVSCCGRDHRQPIQCLWHIAQQLCPSPAVNCVILES